MDASTIADALVSAAAGSLITLGGIALSRVFNKASGLGDIVKNAESIIRSSEVYAEMQGLNVKTLRENPIDWGDDIDGILITDSRHAFLTLKNNGTPQTSNFDLSADSKLVQFEHAKSAMYQLPDLLSQKTEKVDSEIASCARKARRTWTSPSGWQKLAAIFSKQNVYDSRARKISDALTFTAKVLAASPEKDINLSGTCHVAAKWTTEDGKTYVAVMPTNQKEADLVREALNSPSSLGDKTFSGNALIRRIQTLHH